MAGDLSSETKGQIVGARESLNGRENMARRKVKNVFSPFFTFLRAIFSRSSWLSEDGPAGELQGIGTHT